MKKDKIVSEHSSEKAKVAAALFDQQLSRVNGVPQNTYTITFYVKTSRMHEQNWNAERDVVLIHLETKSIQVQHYSTSSFHI